MEYEFIKTERRGAVAVVSLNRPKALNALNAALIAELAGAMRALDADDGVGAIVLTGNERAFAAGADITEMREVPFVEAYRRGLLDRDWDAVAQVRKPTLAAVAGYALGGGCEVAMMCDMMFCADTARFGQPEINLGVPPALGGTQRLTHFIGKSKAMEMCLTGRMMKADEAERCGLVARVFPADALIDEVVKIAETIASKSPLAVMAVKECVNRAYESTLAEGLLFEKRLFHSMFATKDQKEGMGAFVENRTPTFRGE
ncbi:MAG: enoyl-CoA hydratase [Pseudomonadota bacterium]